MRNRFLEKILIAVFTVAVITSAPICSADTVFMSRAKSVRAKLQLSHLSSADKDRFGQQIGELERRAEELDKLQGDLHVQERKVSPAEDEYNSAQREANRLRNDLEAAVEEGKRRQQVILQEATRVCGSLGGQMSGTTCEIKCEPKRPCPSFPAEQFNSQLQAIVNEVQAKAQQVESAQKTADSKEQDWNDKKSRAEEMERDFNAKKDKFEELERAIEQGIDFAPKTVIEPKKGNAYGQALSVLHGLTTRGKTECYDTGCGVTLAAPDVAVPPAIASNPQYQAAVQARHDAEQRAEDARKALRIAESTPGVSAQELTRRFKEDSEAQTLKLKTEFSLANITNLLKPVPPKPAEQNNAK